MTKPFYTEEKIKEIRATAQALMTAYVAGNYSVASEIRDLMREENKIAEQPALEQEYKELKELVTLYQTSKSEVLFTIIKKRIDINIRLDHLIIKSKKLFKDEESAAETIHGLFERWLEITEEIEWDYLEQFTTYITGILPNMQIASV
jgi:hypothetical protein